MLAEPAPSKVLMVGPDEDLAEALRTRFEFEPEVDVVDLGRAEVGLPRLSEDPVNVVVVDGRSKEIDPLDAAVEASQSKADIALIFTIDGTDWSIPQYPGSLNSPRFVSTEACAAEVGRAIEEGEPTEFNVLDLVRIVDLQGSSGAVRFLAEGRKGTLRFENGSIVHAATNVLRGADGFLDMVLWPTGRIERVSTEEIRDCEANIDVAFDLVEEAVRFRAVIAEGEDELDVGAEGERQGVSDAAVPRPRRHSTRTRESPLEVVVACAGQCENLCFGDFAQQLASELGDNPPWVSESAGKPTFGRMHAETGEILAFTFIPLGRRHSFLLEALAQKADAVVVCSPENQAGLENLGRYLEDGVPLAFSNGPEETEGCIRDVLRRVGIGGASK